MLKSCNTLFQTELIYRAQKPGQKTGNLTLGLELFLNWRMPGRGRWGIISDLVRGGQTGRKDSWRLFIWFGKPRVSSAWICEINCSKEKSLEVEVTFCFNVNCPSSSTLNT
uniref:Uncharacterized protein n=1 Tax=Mus spicilegus TaxID=10103 RepID=A0A8C6HBI2_MUSSI